MLLDFSQLLASGMQVLYLNCYSIFARLPLLLKFVRLFFVSTLTFTFSVVFDGNASSLIKLGLRASAAAAVCFFLFLLFLDSIDGFPIDALPCLEIGIVFVAKKVWIKLLLSRAVVLHVSCTVGKYDVHKLTVLFC